MKKFAFVLAFAMVSAITASAATITPMALLVPLFGMGGAALWLGEALPGWKLAAASLIIGGLALNLLWPLLRQRWRARSLVQQESMAPNNETDTTSKGNL